VQDIQDPERALSLAYAPAELRPALALLWCLDEQLGSLVARTDTPAVAQMRLTWWHEALGTARAVRPVDPLLQALADEPRIDLPGVQSLIDGWEVLLDELPLSDAALAQFAEQRGGTLFRAAGRLFGRDDAEVEAAGRLWSLVDLAFRISDPQTAQRALALAPVARDRLPKPLALLAALARHDRLAGLDRPRRQGSPRRVLRGALAVLTGL
jgi:15-cis-phytoene synthase